MNKNKYISLYLPNNVRNELNKTIISVKDVLANSRIEFNEMDYENLHMTLAFMGENIRYVLAKQVKSNVLVEIDKIMRSFNSDLADYSNDIVFEKYDLFPKNKRNLLVAIFKISKKMDASIIEMKKKLCSSAINVLAENIDQEFVPHITLGKFTKITGKENELSELINKLNNEYMIPKFMSDHCVLLPK